MQAAKEMGQLLTTMKKRPEPIDYVNRQGEYIQVDGAVSGLHLRNCKMCDFVCNGRIAHVTIQDCESIRFHFESILSSIDLIRCSDLDVAYSGRCGTITVEASSHVTLNVPVARNTSPPLIVCSCVTSLSLRALDDKKALLSQLDVQEIPSETIEWCENKTKFLLQPLSRATMFTKNT